MQPTEEYTCLNPYSNGILSDDEKLPDDCWGEFVLILILMEYSLTALGLVLFAAAIVLILILMEYSLTNMTVITRMSTRIVLILILMEYSLTKRVSLGTEGE